MPLNFESVSQSKPIFNMLLESIGLGRSHRDSRHALSRLSNHQGLNSGCYDIRHEKNGAHWEGCPNYTPHPRQLTPRDRSVMSSIRNTGAGMPRFEDPTPSMDSPLLQRHHSTPGERYLEGAGCMEALAMGGLGPRSRSIGQTPGGLEALRLGGQDPRGRNSGMDNTFHTDVDRFEGLGNRRLAPPLEPERYAAFEHLMSRNTPRTSHRRLPTPIHQYPLEDNYPNPRMQDLRYHDPRIPFSPMKFQDLGPGPPDIAMAPEHHPAVHYESTSPRLSQRSTSRMMYKKMVGSPHPHHRSLQQSPNPLMYGEMDSPLTSSRYGSIHSRLSSSADLRRGFGLGMEHMMPYTHGQTGNVSRNQLTGHASHGTNYQAPYVEDWVSEVGMGMGSQNDLIHRQAMMEGGGGAFFYDERGGMEGDVYPRSSLV